ncbi:hypothetical protein DL98DRAFT_528887 [Cadophora sp. DSE1049]|nr:hypothetical protein DL98DRAFT_528887 [Cadophora sp. DSE1049]
MSYNQIVKKKLLGTITKNGKQITLSAALQTSQWTGPEFAADAMKNDFEKAVIGYTGPLPEDTTEICVRYATGKWHNFPLKVNSGRREATIRATKTLATTSPGSASTPRRWKDCAFPREIGGKE